MQEDQINIPESIRPYPTPRNPHCRKELWKNQDDLQEMINMQDPNWTPASSLDVYNVEGYIKPKVTTENNAYLTS